MKKKFDKYHIQERIGDGSFAKVYKATDDASHQFAIKQYSTNFLLSLRLVDHQTMQFKDGMCMFENEKKVINILTKDPKYIEHFPKYYQIIEVPEYINLVMDMSKLGSLVSFDDETLTYTLSTQVKSQLTTSYDVYYKRWIAQMIEAVDYLHKQNIAHIDIKLENFLLFGDDVDSSKVKLIDFNSAIVVEDPEYLHGDKYGTILYGSPESYTDLLEGYNPFKADIWALGVCIYILHSLKLPFFDENLIKKNSDCEGVYYGNENTNFEMKYSMLVQKQEVSFEGFDKDLEELLQGMMDKDPNSRWDISKVKESLYIKKIISDKVQ